MQGDTILASPDVPRPPGTPCVLDLYQDAQFEGAGAADIQGAPDFAYAPPAACAGPWAKVVLEADFRNERPNDLIDDIVHTAIELDGVPLYSGGVRYGSPINWHVERDVTDYTRLLQAAHTGRATMTTSAYARVFPAYEGDARLLFYPATAGAPAPRVADEVHPLGLRTWTALGSPAHPGRTKVERSFVLPPNVERAYLDVMAHGDYGEDKLWYSCLPTALMAAYPELSSRFAMGRIHDDNGATPSAQGCDGGSFREIEVSIDGIPAGVAPVFPRLPAVFGAGRSFWMSGGGGTWHPWFAALPNVMPPPRALNFIPYRVDLSPFAGVLSDGARHRIALEVAGADRPARFLVSGTLLVYRDPDSAWVTGQITRNTLVGQPPVAVVASTVQRAGDGTLQGAVTTTRTRSFAIEGDLMTAHGPVRNTVARTVRFANTQDVSGTFGSGEGREAIYRQDIDLQSTVDGVSERYRNGTLVAADAEAIGYPLHVGFRSTTDGFSIAATQHVLAQTQHTRPGHPRYDTDLSNEWIGEYTYDPFNDFFMPRADQTYSFDDTLGSCYQADLVYWLGLLELYQLGDGCPDSQNVIDARARPDGAPNNLGWAEPAVP